MPCRVSSDVHEWTNEGLAVPVYHPANLRYSDEQSEDFYREEKTLWSFTAACCCDMIMIAESSWEPLCMCFWARDRQKCNTSLSLLCRSPEVRDTGRWAVWLGRHPLEKVSRGPKGRLRWVRTPPPRARLKAGLTGFSNAKNSGAKAWPSDPPCPHCWGLKVTEKLPQG